MKSVRERYREKLRQEFLRLTPLERLRTMHEIFVQMIALKARGEGVSEHEIYRRYLENGKGADKRRRRTG